MFQGAVAFNTNVSRWNVSNVTDMQNMFSKARAFSNQDLSNWNVKKVQYHNNFITDAGSNNIEPDFIKYIQY
jgi:surface protein